jgi:hypothetical protein
MRYLAISLATLAVILGLAGGAFVVLSRSLIDLSPQRQREWEQDWTGAARRLVLAAVGIFLLAVFLYGMSVA